MPKRPIFRSSPQSTANVDFSNDPVRGVQTLFGAKPIDLPDNEHPQTAPVNISLGGSLEAAIYQAQAHTAVSDITNDEHAPVVATQIASSADLARGVTGDDQLGIVDVNGEKFVGILPLAAAKATRKDVLARLDSLKIPEPYVPTAAEVERERRIIDLRTASLQLATHVTDVLGAINSLELGAVRDALEDLANFTQKAAFAIDSIPDAKLDLTEEVPAEEPAPRKKRRSKAEIHEATAARENLQAAGITAPDALADAEETVAALAGPAIVTEEDDEPPIVLDDNGEPALPGDGF